MDISSSLSCLTTKISSLSAEYVGNTNTSFSLRNENSNVNNHSQSAVEDSWSVYDATVPVDMDLGTVGQYGAVDTGEWIAVDTLVGSWLTIIGIHFNKETEIFVKSFTTIGRLN